jgi:hypothetical protein
MFVYIIYCAVVSIVVAVAIISTTICVVVRKSLFRELQYWFEGLVKCHVDGVNTQGREWLARFLIKCNLFGAKSLRDNYMIKLQAWSQLSEQTEPQEGWEVALALFQSGSDGDDVCRKLGYVFRDWDSRNSITIEEDFVPDDRSIRDDARLKELCELLYSYSDWDSLLEKLVEGCNADFVRFTALKMVGESRIQDWPNGDYNPLDVLELFRVLLGWLDGC